jgi:hypothetical protein
VHAAEQVLRPQRLAAVRERNDDALTGADEGAELVLGLGEPAGRERRALRLERERLAGRQRIELRGALKIELHVQLLERDLLHLGRLPDEVRRSVERGHEIVRNGGTSVFFCK